MKSHLRLAVLISIAVIPVLMPAGAGAEAIWFTADLEGYLVGCECPSGFSAGISAVFHELEQSRRVGEVLIDLGGLREPDRSDRLLDRYLDNAASRMNYSGVLLTTADMRDAAAVLRKRSADLPVSSAAAFGDRRLFRSIPGEGSLLTINIGSQSLAIGQSAGSQEAARLGAVDGRRISTPETAEILDLLIESDAEVKLLVIRGGIEDWRKTAGGRTGEGPDLIAFTGPDSPAYGLPTGGETGQVDFNGTPVTWFSIAPRGNGIARLELKPDRPSEISFRSLERNISPEDPGILKLSSDYMKDLTAAALRAAGLEAVPDGNEMRADYWYPNGCRDCEDFLWNTVPKIERETGRRIIINEWNTADPDDFGELNLRLESLGVPLNAVPVMIIDGKVLQGDETIKNGLAGIAAGQTGTDSAFRESRVRWEPGAVFLAGLLDGVNPCAFSAMVFLISALALAGRSRQTMLAIGLSYAFGIFITYSLIGAGLLGGLRRVAVETGFRSILEYILAAFLVLLAVLSLVDGIRLSRGRRDLLLKLPDKLSKRVHGIIRDNVRSGAAAGGSFVLGAVVALIELGCTGQVYLPTIAWMISRGDGSAPWLWLLLYNLAFIIPLLTVFVISYKGVTALKMAEVFRKRGALVKYATASLFAILAGVLIIA